MKKKIALLMISIFFLSACSSSQKEKLTASQVLEYLKLAELPIGASVEYTEKTDINELLGRPNQYTSKINFEDTNIEQNNLEDPTGGSIEVFENNEDAQNRADYIENIGKAASFAVEYDYINDYILLRVDKSLEPSQAKLYEKALASIFK